MKLKSLKLTMNIKGNGLVNYNGSDPTPEQRKRYYDFLKHNGKICENNTFAKEYVYHEIDGDGKEKSIVKKVISSGLMRHEILGNENEPNSSMLSDNYKNLRIHYLSQPLVIARGWMITLEKAKNRDIVEDKPEKEDDGKKEKGEIIKRKSGISVMSAIQTCGAVSFMHPCTREGKRDQNSLFYRETCGEIKYQSEIFFDIKQLQFISIDDNYDRMSMYERDVEDYISSLQKQGFNGVKGKFSTTHDNLVGEQGIVLSENLVYTMIEKVIERILNFNILRAGANASFESLFLEYNGENVEIKTIEDFRNLGLEFGWEFKNLNLQD